jgi:hypothetical protein
VADERGSTAVAETTSPYEPSAPYQDELSLVLAAVDSVQSFHKNWSTKIERRYRAYRGIAEKKKKETQSWRSDLTTPYILQVVEGMLATLLDAKPQWAVEPKPLPGDILEEVMGRQQSSKIATAALQWSMDEDRFALKQRPFMQQDLIAGMTVAKCVWAYECRDVTRLVPIEVEISDNWGQIRDKYTDAEEEEQTVCLRDGPSMIVRDVRDFFWPEGAKSIDEAGWVIDRSWETWDALKAKEEAGYFKNVDKLKEARNAESDDLSGREQLLWSQERNKNLIEVLEYWTDDKVITVGGRDVVLASRDNPLRIKRKPFVVCSAMPDAFQIPGISIVETLAQIQEYLWTVQNQRLDALRLLTNVITIIRSDVDDPDSFEFYPGAQWQVEDPGQVTILPIDGTAAQITLEAESLMKGDLQNIMGGLAFAGGTESGLSNAQNTATGMSIVTSIAQRIIQARKQHYLWAFSRVGELFLGMMGQMLREERLIPQIGKAGAQQLMAVHPLHLQGEFNVNISVMDESTVRQEKMSEAMALVNMAAQMGGPQAGLNMQPFIERVLAANGITDTERYFTAQPEAPPGAPGQNGAGGTPPSPETIQQSLTQQEPSIGAGQTNPQLAGEMGGGGMGPGQGLRMSPGQFASQQIQAAQQLGVAPQ